MPQTTPLSGTLRILAGLLLLAGALLAGYLARSLWIIPVMGVFFTLSFVIGRWNRWRMAASDGLTGKVLGGIPLTFLIQCILVAILYLIGYGIGAMARGHDSFAAFDAAVDLVWPALAGTAAAVAGGVIARLERPDQAAGHSGQSELLIDPTPLTPETFFEAIHYSHTIPGKGDKPDRLKPEAHVTAEQIAQREGELGVEFPQLLRQLYLKQNGGHVGWLFVPVKDAPEPTFDDWRGAFSIDYSDLAPLASLRTLWDAYEDFVDMDDPEQVEDYEVPANAKQIILLSQRYMDCTVLDYSQPGPPRAGLVDYDGLNHHDIWFDTFEDLFAALRREQDD